MAVEEIAQPTLHPKSARGSDQGRQRTNNEDLAHVDPELGAYIVIDGVGGQAAGEEAAQIALDHLLARLRDRSDTVERRIREAITLANNEIFDCAQNDEGLRGMACVLTVAVIEGGRMTIGHVGDTRLYKVYRGLIRKVTHDHSPVGEMEDREEISEADAMSHSRRNEIFRDVGSERHDIDDRGFIDIINESFQPESAALICSDGLTDMVTRTEIFETIERRAGDPAAVVSDLIDAANEAGGKDNISVVYIEGDRFADSIRSAPTDFSPSEPARVPATSRFKMSSARGDLGEPAIFRSPVYAERGSSRSLVIQALWNHWTLFLYGALTGILVMYAINEFFGVGSPTGNLAAPERPVILHVGAGGPPAYKTIAEAMEKARAGDTIEVAPGRYAEQVHLKDGVSIVSLKPREAAIVPAGQAAEPYAAVIVEGVTSGRIIGLKIEGGQKEPLAIGVRILNSNVEVADVEVAGAREAGVEIGGTGAPILRGNYIHDNTGAGVVIKDQSAPRLAHNLIAKNGAGKSKKRAGVEILDATARWEDVYNSLQDNGIAGHVGPPGREGAPDHRNAGRPAGAAAGEDRRNN